MLIKGGVPKYLKMQMGRVWYGFGLNSYQAGPYSFKSVLTHLDDMSWIVFAWLSLTHKRTTCLSKQGASLFLSLDNLCDTDSTTCWMHGVDSIIPCALQNFRVV